MDFPQYTVADSISSLLLLFDAIFFYPSFFVFGKILYLIFMTKVGSDMPFKNVSNKIEWLIICHPAPEFLNVVLPAIASQMVPSYQQAPMATNGVQRAPGRWWLPVTWFSVIRIRNRQKELDTSLCKTTVTLILKRKYTVIWCFRVAGQ